MAVCPFAVHKLIAPGSNDPRIKPRAGILHVADMIGPSLYDFFAHRSGGIESHFYVRLDGTVEQYRDTDFQADANLDANDFAVSIETEGRGAGEWTAAQLASIKRLLLWLHDEHGIPLRKIQHWDGSGFGYHTQFGAPSHWTPVAKSCPGGERIKQFNDVLVPWLNSDPRKPRVVTPNITAALHAKTMDARLDALHRVAEHGSNKAAGIAREYIAAIQAREKAEARVAAASKQLRTLEEK